MSLSFSDKLQIIWDHFLRAEPQSYEKSNWLDVFLAELLTQLGEGRDLKDVLSFCSVAEGSVATLIGCELLSDVHRLCETTRPEITGLRDYLLKGRGWRCLAAIRLLRPKELGCSGELVALLLALYPLLGQDGGGARRSSNNPYLGLILDENDDDDDEDDAATVGTAADRSFDTLDPLGLRGRRRRRRRRSAVERQRPAGEPESGEPAARRRRRRRSLNNLAGSRPPERAPLASGSESDAASDGPEQARSLNLLRIRLNPMDFDYFTSVVRSEDEISRRWQAASVDGTPERRLAPEDEPPASWKDALGDRAAAVLEASVSQFEASLLVLELLRGLQQDRHRQPGQVLKFAVDALWALQFVGGSEPTLTGPEVARLKAAASRLALASLERALQADEPSAPGLIHSGLLPMALRLLEDACVRAPTASCTPGEGSLLQRFIFATMQLVLTFLYSLLRQRGASAGADRYKDFLELFQLFAESQEGRLVERAVLTMLELPSVDRIKSSLRAAKIVDTVGSLLGALKLAREEIGHSSGSRRRFKSTPGPDEDGQDSHHHSDALGLPYFSEPSHVVSARASLSKAVCAISSLFATFVSLLKESHSLPSELQLHLVKVMGTVGTCCCFPSKFLLSSLAQYLGRAHPQCYTYATSLIEQTIFKELGGYPITKDTCNFCSSLNVNSWDFLRLYAQLLSPDDSKLCRAIMRHLLKVTGNSTFVVKQELLFGVFYPTFLASKLALDNGKGDFSTLKFLLQSCLSAFTSLVSNVILFQKFVDVGGLDEVLSLQSNQTFVKSVYAFLEISVMMEMKIADCNEDNNEVKDSTGPAMKALFQSLERETNSLSMILQKSVVSDETNESAEEKSRQKSVVHRAGGVWRAAAGIILSTPKFRPEFFNNSVFLSSTRLAELLAINVATDNANGPNKFFLRVMEAIITSCLIASFSDKYDIVSVLRNALINENTKLSRGIGALVEMFLQVAMLRPSQEHTISHQNRIGLSTMTMDVSTDWGEVEDSSAGEYITADDGYEADVEIPIKNSQNTLSKRINNFGGAIDRIKESPNAHPALCSLTIDILIHYAKPNFEEEEISIVTSGLRKVAVICKESVWTCAALARNEVITRILDGFKSIFVSQDRRYQDLQHAALEVLTLLAMQSISPAELVTYLTFFKSNSPPLLCLLEPLYRLVLTAKPQPYFILSFPAKSSEPLTAKILKEDYKNLEKAENLVSNFRKKHLALEICSPWSVHAICLPIITEMSWPVWLYGCSVSLWLRVERGNSNSHNKTRSAMSDNSLPNSESDSMSDWGLLSDNWSRDVIMGSAAPPAPVSILHMMSIGFESLVLETWLDLRSDKLILRLTRPDDKTNRTISETWINGMLPSGRWHHLAINFNDTVLNKHSAIVEVVIWVDGWKEIKAQLPFDGLLIRKPGTTCVLLGQTGPAAVGAWYLSNLMIFRCPVFNSERAMYLASLGPNFTSLADCVLSNVKPDFSQLIASGALNGIRETKFDSGKFHLNKKKPSKSTKYAVEVEVSESKIDWDSVMDSTNSHLIELQDNLLLNYEAQNPNTVHLYPQAVGNANAVVKTLFPGQPGFRVVTDPEHRVSQQPPLSIPAISTAQVQCQSYKGLVSSASLIGGMPIFLYLFARVVELNSSEEEQALALSVILHLARSDSEMLNQYRAEGGASLLIKVLESARCYAGKYMLKTILDAACDSPVLVRDPATKNHSICQSSEAVITDPDLLKCALEAWKIWATYDALNLLLQAMLFLLKDQHPHREFNASQMNRRRIVDAILVVCKEHFMYEDARLSLDSTTGSAIVELIRALMGAPPEFSHLVSITDYLVLVHQASETYVTHSRHNMYFLLTPLDEVKNTSNKSPGSGSPIGAASSLENSKLSKALKNVQIQKESLSQEDRPEENCETSSQGPDTSAGEDSGIVASEGSNQRTNERRQPHSSDRKKACQGLVCEGLLLLLRDALRVLPDSQVAPVLRHVLRVELLLVLSNNPDARVRTALLKLVQVYLQRANDEQTNKFIKQRYFLHLANQISLYPGSEPLVVTLENLALKGPGLAAVTPVLAMIPRAAATDLNVARPLVSFITDLVTKNPSSLRSLLEQGLMESLAKAVVAAAHANCSSSLLRDVHVLLVAVASKLLDSPGGHQMQAVTELHVVLNHSELQEGLRCGSGKSCVAAVRDAQVALFDGELDVLAAKASNHSAFRLKSAASYLASASYLSNALTTSSEQSDHGSRSSSYGSLHLGSSATMTREPGKAELNERFRLTLNRAVDFLTTADSSPSTSELQLTKRLFSILLHGISSPTGRKVNWVNAWSAKPALRKNTAKIMVWLMSPHQSNSTRVYAVRSLMEEPRPREILVTLLEVHPQVEQKFSVFLWDLLEKRDEMPSADGRVCAELREALKIWDLAKSIDQGNPETWAEELTLLRRELARERDIWIESQIPAIHRICSRYETLTKQLTESAMSITRSVVEEQNRERKALMERLKHGRALEAQSVAKWRELARRLSHERAAWFFPESYPRSWELDPTEGPARVRTRLQRCHLHIDERFFLPEHKDKLSAAQVEAPLSYLFAAGRPDASASALIERLHTSERIRRMSPAKVVTPQAELSGEALIGEACFYFVPESPTIPLHPTDIALGGLDLAMAGGTAWRLEDIRELHRRRYQLQEKAIEIFLVTGRTYLLAFNSSKERDDFALELSNCNLPRRIPGDDLGDALALWRNGTLTNWEYVTCLNKLAGRSYNDLMQYPVFPFVLSDYTSEVIDLNNPKIYRNFKRPMAVQDKKNEQHYINNYNYLKQALSEGLNLVALNQEPFHYGSHYSNSGTVLHFLVRLPPFTSMFLNYQDDNFDIPDRTFHALATTWRLTSCDSTTDVKELIPEFFYLPEFLLNFEGFDFGVRQNGHRVGDVELPNWCGGDARLFVLAHRAALESDIVREVLPYWIDLVFGFRQTGKPAVEAINVFHPATYYGFNVEQIADPLERQAWETMVKTYGQTPAQLFKAAHPLPLQNIVFSSNNIPQVIEGVHGIRWGNYVGAPGNDPAVCWKHKHRVLLASLIPLSTGDVFGLPICTTLLLAYSKDKGASMLNSTSVLGAALASWSSTDGIARLKTKKEQPPRPLIRSTGLDSITVMKSAPDCEQFWVGYTSGRIVVYEFTVGIIGKIDFNSLSPSVLLAHSNQITFIELSRAFSIAVSSDSRGVFVIWDLNSLAYVRSIVCEQSYPISLISISETLGDIAVVYQIPHSNEENVAENRSELKVYTINSRLVGSVLSRRRITALSYSNAVEGVSVNVIAIGLDDGLIRLWSSWDLRLVREINNAKGCGAIIALTWSYDQHHLYAATEDCTVIIWEGSRKLDNGTPKFVNLSTL